MKYDEFGGIVIEDEDELDEFGGVVLKDESDKPPAQTPPTPPRTGILSEIGQNLSKRWESVKNPPEYLEKGGKGYIPEVSELESIAQAFGNVAGVASDVAGPVISRIAKKVPIPEKAKDIAGKISSTYQKYVPERVSKDVEGVLSIPIAGAAAVGGKAIAKSVGESIVETGATTGAGKAMKEFAKVGQGKNWKLSGTPEQVAAKRDVAALNDVWGDARKAGEVLQPKISEKYNALKARIDQHGADNNVQVNLLKKIDDAEAAALKSPAPHKEASIRSIFESVRKKLKEKYPNGTANLTDAQLYKQEVGDWADDAFDVTSKGRPVSAQPVEHQVYLNIYDQIKKEIENAGPDGVKEANQELSKMLDLRRDLRKRVAVEERNKFMPLDEVVSASAALASGNPAAMALYGGQVAARNPSVQRAIYNLGDKLEKKPKELPKKEFAKERSTTVGLPEDIESPTFARRGMNVDDYENTGGVVTPITDKSRLLPPPMIGEGQAVEAMIPTVGDRIRAIGTNPIRETDYTEMVEAGKLSDRLRDLKNKSDAAKADEIRELVNAIRGTRPQGKEETLVDIIKRFQTGRTSSDVKESIGKMRKSKKGTK